MTMTPLKALEMTRHIREQHARQAQHMTPSERLAFYQAKARTMDTIAPQPTIRAVRPQPTAETDV